MEEAILQQVAHMDVRVHIDIAHTTHILHLHHIDTVVMDIHHNTDNNKYNK